MKLNSAARFFVVRLTKGKRRCRVAIRNCDPRDFGMQAAFIIACLAEWLLAPHVSSGFLSNILQGPCQFRPRRKIGTCCWCENCRDDIAISPSDDVAWHRENLLTFGRLSAHTAEQNHTASAAGQCEQIVEFFPFSNTYAPGQMAVINCRACTPMPS